MGMMYGRHSDIVLCYPFSICCLEEMKVISFLRRIVQGKEDEVG